MDKRTLHSWLKKKPPTQTIGDPKPFSLLWVREGHMFRRMTPVDSTRGSEDENGTNGYHKEADRGLARRPRGWAEHAQKPDVVCWWTCCCFSNWPQLSLRSPLFQACACAHAPAHPYFYLRQCEVFESVAIRLCRSKSRPRSPSGPQGLTTSLGWLLELRSFHWFGRPIGFLASCGDSAHHQG